MRQREYRLDGWMDRANTARVPGYFGRSPDCCCVYIQIPNQWDFLKYKYMYRTVWTRYWYSNSQLYTQFHGNVGFIPHTQ